MKRIFFLLPVCLFLGYFAAPTDAWAGGGTIASFGKRPPSTPAPPAPPAPQPIPDTTPQEAESAAVRDDERRKLRQKTGVSGTLLAPLGQSGGGSRSADSGQSGNTLLGRLGR
jgi:hypothetical protein